MSGSLCSNQQKVKTTVSCLHVPNGPTLSVDGGPHLWQSAGCIFLSITLFYKFHFIIFTFYKVLENHGAV